MAWHKPVFIFIIMAILLVQTASATVVSRNCTASYAWENVSWYYNNTEYRFDSIPVHCAYGCADNGLECAEPTQSDSGMLLTIGVILGMIAALFAYLGKNVQWGGEKYSWPLQVMFLFFCLLFILLDIGIISGFSVYTQNNISDLLGIGYVSMIFLLLVVMMFFMVMLLIKAVEYMTSRGGGNEKGS